MPKTVTRRVSADEKNLLREAGSKATPARLKMIQVLQRAGRPLSIKNLLQKVGGVDQATLYRSLTALEKSGLIRQVDLRHGHVHYELVDPSDHHHLICIRCGRVEDFSGCGIEHVIRRALKTSKQFSSVREHSLELFGLCTTCARKV